jgi:predicted transcriptional regulator with HTH domain
MQQENDLEHSIDIKRPLVIRALNTSEIAYYVKTTPTNVIGAMRGMESRYKEDESLLGLGLVEEIKGGKNIRLYSITTFGKKVMESLKIEDNIK